MGRVGGRSSHYREQYAIPEQNACKRSSGSPKVFEKWDLPPILLHRPILTGESDTLEDRKNKYKHIKHEHGECKCPVPGRVSVWSHYVAHFVQIERLNSHNLC